jgi:hypothetical protein
MSIHANTKRRTLRRKIPAKAIPARTQSQAEMARSLHLNLGNAVLRLKMFEEVLSQGRASATGPVLELLSDQLKRCASSMRQLTIANTSARMRSR